MLLLLESGIVLAENDLDQQNYEIFSRFGSSNCFFGTASPTGVSEKRCGRKESLLA